MRIRSPAGDIATRTPDLSVRLLDDLGGVAQTDELVEVEDRDSSGSAVELAAERFLDRLRGRALVSGQLLETITRLHT